MTDGFVALFAEQRSLDADEGVLRILEGGKGLPVENSAFRGACFNENSGMTGGHAAAAV